MVGLCLILHLFVGWEIHVDTDFAIKSNLAASEIMIQNQR